MTTRFRSNELEDADLVVDAVYEGGRKGNAGDDPLPALLGVSNQGGFRYRGSIKNLELVVLTSTLNDPDWPDELDRESGIFTYFGDNKKPGRGLHETPRFGNRILRDIFNATHRTENCRVGVPPIFVFANSGEWRDMVFLGLSVPGAMDLHGTEDLLALWKIAEGQRFQNYVAKFTILDVPTIRRLWIKDINSGNPFTNNCPEPWGEWVETGSYRPLRATRSLEYRNKKEQLPSDPEQQRMLKAMYDYFADNSVGFEACAARLAQMMDSNVMSIDLTRPTRDGGRDGLGKYRIGRGMSGIHVDFALEAKCYAFDNPVSVRDTSRLLSRLRHRQFGILVTTSYVHSQAYKEIKEDGQPVVILAATDIARILTDAGIATETDVRKWLRTLFPR